MVRVENLSSFRVDLPYQQLSRGHLQCKQELLVSQCTYNIPCFRTLSGLDQQNPRLPPLLMYQQEPLNNAPASMNNIHHENHRRKKDTLVRNITQRYMAQKILLTLILFSKPLIGFTVIRVQQIRRDKTRNFNLRGRNSCIYKLPNQYKMF